MLEGSPAAYFGTLQQLPDSWSYVNNAAKDGITFLFVYVSSPLRREQTTATVKINGSKVHEFISVWYGVTERFHTHKLKHQRIKQTIKKKPLVTSFSVAYRPLPFYKKCYKWYTFSPWLAPRRALSITLIFRKTMFAVALILSSSLTLNQSEHK